MIAATLWALVTHLQVLPSLDRQYDPNGAVLYAEPTPNSRYSLSVTHSDVKGYAVKIGTRFKF